MTTKHDHDDRTRPRRMTLTICALLVGLGAVALTLLDRMPSGLVLPAWAYWLALIFASLGTYSVVIILLKRVGLIVSTAIAGLAMCIMLLEGGARLLLHNDLASATTAQLRIFSNIFDRDKRLNTNEGDELNYTPRPYLGFALNPNVKYMGYAQFNSEYLIRRTEPIRHREDVRVRILVLGGSTTFGAGIAKEEDTWVKILEGQLHSRFGKSIEVINGGVGAYNVVENMLHYILILQKLDPDIILLVTGLNDVHPRLIGKLAPDYSNSRIVWNSDPLPKPKEWLRWSKLYQLWILKQIEKGKFGHINAVVQRSYPDVHTWPTQLKQNRSGEYERHLSTLVSLLKAEGRQVVIVPQLSIPPPNDLYYEYFGIGVWEHNLLNRRVARRFKIPFVEEAVAPGAFQSRLLFDDCHFNEEGSQRMASILARWFENHVEIFSSGRISTGNEVSHPGASATPPGSAAVAISPHSSDATRGPLSSSSASP